MYTKNSNAIILALSFGKRKKNFITNKANSMIAAWAIIFANLFESMIVADDSVPLHEVGWRNTFRRIGKKDGPDAHESTLSLLKSARFLYDFMGKTEKINVFIITAPPYTERAVRDAKKVFKNTNVTIRGLNIIEEKWFHADSNQLYTTSPWLWWPREIFLRMLPFRLYSWLSEWFDG